MQAPLLEHFSWASTTCPCEHRSHGTQQNMMVSCTGCTLLLECRKLYTAMSKSSNKKTFSCMSRKRTSFQRCLDILSIPVTGSINTSLATRVSGIHIAQSKWTHSPCTVCLKAPPSFGQSIHSLNTQGQGREDWWDQFLLTTGFSGETVHFRQSHWPSGIYGTP